MLESFMVAFNAVGPFLILLGIGFAAVRLKLADRPFMDRLNALNYKVFFPFLMFNNVYGAKPENMPSVKLMVTGVLSVSLLVVLLVIIVPRIVKENPRRGVVIQGIFRSNFVVYGIPLTNYVFGPEKTSVCGMVILVMVSRKILTNRSLMNPLPLCWAYLYFPSPASVLISCSSLISRETVAWVTS